MENSVYDDCIKMFGSWILPEETKTVSKSGMKRASKKRMRRKAHPLLIAKS